MAEVKGKDYQLDMLQQEVRIGDKVIVTTQRYANMHIAYVTRITPKGIRAGHTKDSIGEIKYRGQFVKV